MSRITWDIGKLPQIVAESLCWVDVIRALGLSERAAGNWRTVQKHTKRLNLDTSHFTGIASGRGKVRSRPLEDVLIANSDYSRESLKKRLLSEGLLEAKCSICELVTWLNAPISLELDHINGINNDNRIENLRLLCPNCHAQTPTWRGRNQKKPGPRTKMGYLSTKGTTPRKTKINWPSQIVLQSMVEEFGYAGTGNKLGVSDNAVKKRLNKGL